MFALFTGIKFFSLVALVKCTLLISSCHYLLPAVISLCEQKLQRQRRWRDMDIYNYTKTIVLLWCMLLLISCTASSPATVSPLVSPSHTNEVITANTYTPSSTPISGNMSTSASSTHTPIPTVTHSNVPESITPTFFAGPLIAFPAQNHHAESVIVLLDLATATTRQITSHMLGGTIVAFDWASDGCELYVALEKAPNIQYVRVNLMGELISEQSQPIPYQVNDGIRDAWTMSPTADWIAYLLYSGEESDFDTEFQDVGVISNGQNDSQSIMLTDREWSVEATWSPTGDRLAYTLLDTNGIPQLHHANADGRDQIQLTHFVDPIHHIEGIRWSPDGTGLIFNVYSVAEPLNVGASSLWSVDRTGHNLQQADLKNFIVRQPAWWSQDGHRYAAIVENWEQGPEAGNKGEKIVWIDRQDGAVLHQFWPAEAGIQFEHVFPVGGIERIGFLGRYLTVYNISTESIELFVESPLEQLFPSRINPSIAPYHFEGERSCS